MRMMLLVLAIVSILACAEEGSQDISRELEPAQRLLAAKKYDEAYDEYVRCAEEKDNPLAQFTVGMFHRVGWGREIDEAKACDWFEKAAERDIPVAQHYFAEYLLDGRFRTADPERAAEFFSRAGDLGHYLSFYSLGTLYMEGLGVSKDTARGLEFMKMAADHGAVVALVPVARLLLSGEAGKRDPAAAWSYFERAAAGEEPDPEAEYMLGIMSRDGLGVPRNHDLAHHWLELSAARGHLPAYLPCAEEFLKPHHGAKPSGEHVAKAYLWTSAAVKRMPKGDEKQRATALRDRVLAMMPQSWQADLDKKVEEHLKHLAKKDP